MDIRDIDHVEFYVGDAQQAAFYLCTTFGFRICGQAGPETGLSGQRSLLLRHSRVQLVLTSGLTAEHPASVYVARHGDGVASIAFRVPDARLAFAEASDRAATPVRQPVELKDANASVTVAEVGGFGDATHRLVERQGADSFLPGRMDMLVPDPEDDPGLLDVIDHVAVCLPAGTLDATVDYYRAAFGFTQIFEEYVEVGRQAMNSKVVQSPSGGVTFTLIEPDSRREPGQIDSFLRDHGGPGVQHLAFLTADIVTAVRTFQHKGARFLDTPDAYYDGLAARLGETDLDIELLRTTNVLVDRDQWGEVFQIFTRSMHVRRTYFMEVIDRHGARTFGSGNIKALYAAVSRDNATAPAGR